MSDERESAGPVEPGVPEALPSSMTLVSRSEVSGVSTASATPSAALAPEPGFSLRVAAISVLDG
ncbi:hypothetical protein [Amycolatopsis sp. DSM 110486]|uniref:hypothetical protein n=1 Tax=Amycolatopsis sp. DSM 110486 TaxID=2865832 RepID=UPI001C6A231D|nr:hypothetical protein [Amycolatopsis sp. DSM 110486]QYN20309.1 hypothetical protein K1T34_48620 [Amycolatopsis sp. DSM 110486]